MVPEWHTTKIQQDKKENLHSPKTTKEIEFLIKKLPQNKSSSLDDLTRESYQIINTILYNVFQKIEDRETLHNSFHESSFTLLPKVDRILKRKIIDQYVSQI